MHGVDLASSKQCPGYDVGWTFADNLNIGGVTLMAHAGKSTVRIKTNHSVCGRWLFYNTDWFTHSGSNPSVPIGQLENLLLTKPKRPDRR